MVMLFMFRYVLISIFLPLCVFSALECELYIAESTIPNAGIGIFTGTAKSVEDTIGNGDKAIPFVDVYFNNDHFIDGRKDPAEDYVWSGVDMGMGLESQDEDDILCFWPGVNAMVNSHLGLFNVHASTPVYDEDGLHRSKHPGAGSMSPYNAGKSSVSRDIPIGGEIFKSYGDGWFTDRPHFGNIPVMGSYQELLDLLGDLVALLDKNDDIDVSPSIIYDEIIRELKILWDSRTLNAIFDYDWKDMRRAIDANDMGPILQPSATRSIEWLNKNGKCIDHIVHGRSTINGAGSGAFAKRDLPKDTIVTGTPVLVFPTDEWFDMYDWYICPDDSVTRDTTTGPIGQQLLLNYCFGHPESTTILCPYGSGVNYINHNKTRANIRVQWAQNGVTGHKDESLHQEPNDDTKIVLDYVATRDIAEGEELFLDYGDVWEEKWNRYSESWKRNKNPSLDNYISAIEFNRLIEKDPILTADEQLLDPYPDNLSTRCHLVVCESEGFFSKDAYDPSEWIDLWCECQVLGRNDKDESYWVEVVNYGNNSKDVWNVPREVIKLADVPYTTDIHMMGSFRQPLGIPDDILPDAWRNDKRCSAEDPTCQIEEKSDKTYDPCTISEDQYDDYIDSYINGEYDEFGYVYDDGTNAGNAPSRRSRIRGV